MGTMVKCELNEETGCNGIASRRIVWNGLGVIEDHIVHICDECRETYDAVILIDLGPIDPRDIPSKYRSRTLNRWIDKIDWDSIDDILEDCWEWHPDRARVQGYAAFWFGGGTGYGHRYSFERFYGIKPPAKDDEVEILHECDNKPCVNPAHLWIGTRGENIQHAVETGRIERAITDVEVEKEICRVYENNDVSLTDVAEEYDVSRSTIHRIISGERTITA